MAGHVGQELGDEVVDRRSSGVDGVALGAGAEPGLLTGDIKIADGVVDGEAAQVGVVNRLLQPRPERGTRTTKFRGQCRASPLAFGFSVTE